MANFFVKFEEKDLGRKYKVKMDEHAKRHKNALMAATKQARDISLREARLNISSAGKFGPRWTKGLTADITETQGDIVTQYNHAIPYWSVFQFGKVIHGKPLLWIPLSFAHDAQGKRARDFPGGLFRVDRKAAGKAPLLFSVSDKEPKYFGKEQVRIPKKFRVLEIIRLVSSNIKLFFAEQLGKQK